MFEINIAKFRVAFARIRTATSYLHINRRLLNPTANVACPFCKRDETELHFLIQCEAYKDIRDRYIRKHFYIEGTMNPNINLKQILANESVEITKDIAMFTHCGLKLRSDKLRQIQLQKKITSSILRRNRIY